MKRFFYMIISLFLLFSCGSIPEPDDESQSLVIGYLVWDFPDRFFDENPKKIEYSVILNVLNLSTGKKNQVRTAGGYFKFLCNGRDSFLLESIEYGGTMASSGKIYFPGIFPLQAQIDTEPDKIIYTGHILVTSSKPERVKTRIEPFSQKVEATWEFRQDVSVENKVVDMKQYLKEKAPESVWLSSDILNLYENVFNSLSVEHQNLISIQWIFHDVYFYHFFLLKL